MPTKSSEKLRHLKGSLLLGAGVGGLRWWTPFPKKTQKGLVSREGLPNQSLVNESFGKILPRQRRAQAWLPHCALHVANIPPRFSHRNSTVVLEHPHFHLMS